MQKVKMRDFFRIANPDYDFIKITPNNSVKNTDTHLLARTIASLYKTAYDGLHKEQERMMRIMGRDFFVGTQWRYNRQPKIAYYIHITAAEVTFYMVIPSRSYNIIKGKISDIWHKVTIEQVDNLPLLNDKRASHYQMAYSKEDGLSLKTDRRDNDLLERHLSVLDVMEQGDEAAILYNFVPASQKQFKHRHSNTMDKVNQNAPTDRNKTGGAYLLKQAANLIDGLIQSLTDAIAGESAKKDDSLIQSLTDRLSGEEKIGAASRGKGDQIVLDNQTIVSSRSPDRMRQRNNARILTQGYDTIAGDNRLKAKPFKGNMNICKKWINGAEVNQVSDTEAQNLISLPGRSLIEEYPAISKINTQEASVPTELRDGVMRIGTSTYRGTDQPAYLSNDKEFKYLSTVLIGPNRAGKTTLMSNLSYDAIQNGETTIILDYIGNCELSDEIADNYPDDQVLNIDCSDPDKMEGLGYNEAGRSADPFIQYDNAKKQTTQLMTLINAINADDTYLSPKMERYLTSAALIVFIQTGSIKDVFNVLQDFKSRHGFIDAIPDDQQENTAEYAQSLYELDDIDKEGNIKGTRINNIVGIIDRLNKLKANTYMEMMLKKSTDNNINLVDEMQRNQLICIRMPENMFPTDNERDVYATYWITKLWMALQIRKSKYSRDNMTKVNLIIDELYQIPASESFLTSKLSRLPKFNIKPIISCHYLYQIKIIRDELRSASASYMILAGSDRQNYDELKRELYPFELDDLLKLPRYHALNLIKTRDGYGKFITRLPKPIGGS